MPTCTCTGNVGSVRTAHARWAASSCVLRVLPHQVVCHGIPDARELQSGDIVNVDVTACLNGYCGDLNEVRACRDDMNYVRACLCAWARCARLCTRVLRLPG